MTSFLQLVASLREQMQANLSRSDVLKPLAWLIGLLLTGVVLTSVGDADPWVIGVLLSGVGFGVVLYMGAYVFCLLNDRDALRSERYSLHKMAIEQRLLGDSDGGLFEPEEVTPAPLAIASNKPEQNL